MDPLTAAAVVTAVAGIAQAYNGEKARGANEQRLRELRKAFESIVPPDYDVSINDPPQYIEKVLQGADLDFSRITPEDFKVVGQYSPQAANFMAEANPTLLKGSDTFKEGRKAQLDALRQMQSAAKGDSPEFNIGLQRARDASQASAQSRQQSIIDDAQRRGLGGSGIALAAQLQGTGDSMAQGAALSQQAAIEAYRQKLAATQQAGSMGRQLAGDELSMERANADVINDFNQRSSRQYQDYLNMRSQMQNDAQLRNLQVQQSTADRNVAARNEADRFNLENRNRLGQQAYQNTRDERNYQNTLAEQRANWSAAEKDRQNRLKSQSYSDQMARQNSMSGLAGMEMQNRMQGAQDRNAMIQGVGSAASGYFAGQAQADAQREAQRREDERWDRLLRMQGPMAGQSYLNTRDIA
jgi:hypothetical protein